MSGKYKGDDLTVLVPTKDRPEKVRNLLESLLIQTVTIDRVIIVDGGESVLSIVESFSSKLPVEHYPCNPAGQIRQRNYGISLLNEKTPLVAFLDDDIVLQPDAVEQVLNCWNRSNEKTAAISFNIVNAPRHSPSRLWVLLGFTDARAGKILKSGYSTSISDIKQKDIKADWVIGGATVWRQEILKQFPQREINVPWAVNEDVIYSYPIGKIYPFYVCNSACVRHEHVFDQYKKKNSFDYFKRGYVCSLWRFYFVSMHQELSVFHSVWVEFARISQKTICSLLQLDKSKLMEAAGLFKGTFRAVISLLRKESLLDLLIEKRNK